LKFGHPAVLVDIPTRKHRPQILTQLTTRHQAHKRGVKIIGATAHYVTADLDEGPIIVQEVKPINHGFTIEQMVHLGHDLEAIALCNAVKMHAEQRICINKDKTVILS
jgi:formyltetrahydrofolate deformylase